VNDRVDRALRALREQETGASSHAEETLQRVLAERLAVQRAWRRRARMWIPIAAVLAISTAALARWGSMGTVRALFLPRDQAAQTQRDVALPPPSSNAAPAPSATDAGAPVVESEEMLPPMPSTAASVTTPLSTTSMRAGTVSRTSMPASSVPAKGVVSAVATPAVAAPSASISAPATVPPSRPVAGGASSESDAYEHAHRLHFGGGAPAAALGAWDDYLLRFPDGRFAPDARYNRAIDLVKLHRYVEARAALQPFAEGSFGGYHRDDARELLRSIP
jgi:TolA-binding protein